MKKAVFAGSFDPFTNGHLEIVKKASLFFDAIYVVIGVNPKKQRKYNALDMKDLISDVLSDNGIHNFRVSATDDLITNFAKENGVQYFIRGLRNATDFAYEESMASVNKLLLPEIEYVYFRSDSSEISSSMVNELFSHNIDVSTFVPDRICRYMKERVK